MAIAKVLKRFRNAHTTSKERNWKREHETGRERERKSVCLHVVYAAGYKRTITHYFGCTE